MGKVSFFIYLSPHQDCHNEWDITIKELRIHPQDFPAGRDDSRIYNFHLEDAALQF